jgi:uncharacterized protein (TIGR02231 family)
MVVLAADIALAEDLTVSQISKVTVFTNQALIMRQAKANVTNGRNEILIGLDAFNIDKDSVSATVLGEGELLSVQLKDIYLKEAPQENIQAIEKKIKDLKEAKKQLGNERLSQDRKEKFLDSIINFSQAQVGEDIKTAFPKTEDLSKALAFLDESQAAINKKRESIDIETEDIDKQIAVLERELDSLKGPERKSKKVIEVVFNSAKEQQIEIEASYLAYNARWNPIYKVDVPSALNRVSLIMFSNIAQNTGEDWKDVRLNISNVIPLKGIGLPTLESWILDIVRYEAKPTAECYDLKESSMLSKGMVAGPKQEVISPAPDEKKKADFAQAQKRELPLSFEYQLLQPLTIESKEKETLLPLFAKELSGDFYHYTVPSMSPLVFLVCKTKADKELLSGALNVYFGGRYIGKTFLSEKKAGDEFEVSLGADRELKVKKEKIKDKIDETFFGKIERQTIVRAIGYKITMENIKDKAVKLKIIDNVPVSKTDKIEVKDLKISPEPIQTKYQDKEGVMLWEFNLNPGEKKEIAIEFVLTYPKDIPVYGT